MKNKHAKGPDGQPLINFNSGRGRGRPKKSSIGMTSLVDSTKVDYFRTLDKIGGPVEPTYGFDEIYTEIFIKKKSNRDEDASESDDQSHNAFQDEFEKADDKYVNKKANRNEERQQSDDIDEIENEEEIYMRREEYKRHPLFNILVQYTDELQEYI
jgi:hypothetical protein